MSSDLSNQDKLEQIYKLTLENNNILHGLRNRERIGNILKIVYWLVILGALGGVYYYIKPVLNYASNNRTGIQDTINQFEQLRSQFPETKALQGLFKQMKSQDTNTAADTASTTGN